MVVAVRPTSVPGDALPVPIVAVAELPVAPLPMLAELLAVADVDVVEVPLGGLVDDDELQAPTARMAAATIPRSTEVRARVKRLRGALNPARAAPLPLSMPTPNCMSLRNFGQHNPEKSPDPAECPSF
jgi:hypothetical protein